MGAHSKPEAMVVRRIIFGLIFGLFAGVLLYSAGSELSSLNQQWERSERIVAGIDDSLDQIIVRGEYARRHQDALDESNAKAYQVLGGVLAVVALGFIGSGIFSYIETEKVTLIKQLKTQHQGLIALVTKHKELLLAKREKGSFVDEYGILRTDDWQAEKTKFIENVVLSELNCHTLSKLLCPFKLIDEVLDGTHKEAFVGEKENILNKES